MHTTTAVCIKRWVSASIFISSTPLPLPACFRFHVKSVCPRRLRCVSHWWCLRFPMCVCVCVRVCLCVCVSGEAFHRLVVYRCSIPPITGDLQLLRRDRLPRCGSRGVCGLVLGPCHGHVRQGACGAASFHAILLMSACHSLRAGACERPPGSEVPACRSRYPACLRGCWKSRRHAASHQGCPVKSDRVRELGRGEDCVDSACLRP